MSLDVSDAIALAKDLLKTSTEFHTHDPALAAEIADRAFEICDDLGIDRSEIGNPPLVVASTARSESKTDRAPASTRLAERTAVDLDDNTQQTNEQLQALLTQQAKVLRNARDSEARTDRPKATKRSFWPFGRTASQELPALQSA